METPEVIYFKGCIEDSVTPNCIISNKKWKFNNMIVPINCICYINTMYEYKYKKLAILLAIIGLILVIGSMDQEFKSLGFLLIIIGVGLLWYAHTHPIYYVQIGTAATKHNFKCDKNIFKEIYNGMNNALNDRIF